MSDEKKVVKAAVKDDAASVNLVNYVIERADAGDPSAQRALTQFQQSHPEAFNTDPNRAKLYELADTAPKLEPYSEPHAKDDTDHTKKKFSAEA